MKHAHPRVFAPRHRRLIGRGEVQHQDFHAVDQGLSGIDPAGIYTLSFWYLPNPGTNNLHYRLSSGFRSTKAINLRPAFFTPGAINSAAAPLPEFPELWINEVAVAASYQGRGIGKAMMQQTLELARRLGCEEAWVLTERSNTAAMNLYASSGGAVDSGDTVMFTFPLDHQ